MTLPVADGRLERSIQSDLPREVIESDIAGVVYEAYVDPKGRITQCKVAGVLGNEREEGLAKGICAAVKGKSVKSPARDADGMRMPAVFRGVVSLANNSIALDRFPIEPDVRYQVDQLPDGAKSAVRRNLVVQVDGQGQITACGAAGGKETPDTATACDIVQSVTLPIRKGADGQGESYLYPLLFEFTDKPLVALAD
ncbi:hypothetical protein [Erythrobacter sp. SG61-1L]|uniref:hypothetical protein n=1 Tax=Erythrobacter sp. SG61-1L TaxID=1603897 RepID=UPI0019D70BD7|nr:hypothetical protein [Erythrobacter sp. SG61-1L]